MSSVSLPLTAEWGHHPPEITPDDLITAVSEAVKGAVGNFSALPDGPEPCSDAKGYCRASVEIPLPRTLADQLMNGPTGYRAHYSISIDAGERFNRSLVEAVAPLIIEAKHLYNSQFDWQFCRRSLLGRFSKFWYPKQVTDPSSNAYLLTLKEVIVHTRWVDYWGTRPKPYKGLLAPVSENSSILFNGTFVSDDGSDYEQKPSRSQQIFESGWT
ncbi:hypothetical protein [Burkholderia stagnalis]|uniref:hypothetical protein n=1 Tax=Burkholderia stagnalis TaxID=1503054 RepID=UPI000A427A4C|nr:hypothetical protein [Burkholderia stagnalis]